MSSRNTTKEWLDSMFDDCDIWSANEFLKTDSRREFDEWPVEDRHITAMNDNSLSGTTPSATSDKLADTKGRGGGVAYCQLTVYGSSCTKQCQKTFLNYPLLLADALFGLRRKLRKTILRDFEGLVESGQMLLVLGKPGSGCTTLLRTLAGHINGLSISEKSSLNYQGFLWATMRQEFQGECTYEAESDVHFPHLTVTQTMDLAAEARTPSAVWPHSSSKTWAREKRDATLASLGLTHSRDTKVGNDFVHGISGGERKRLSIAEVLVSNSVFQCWDNSTRGLDSGNARNFLRTLRSSLNENCSVALVALYQASQDMYDAFDLVVLLYEGRQIFFGKTTASKAYFTNLGFECTRGLTTSDFLTSLTDPMGRVIREGYEKSVPRSPDEFVQRWKESSERAALINGIEAYQQRYPVAGIHIPKWRVARYWQQIIGRGRRSPFLLSFGTQIGLCVRRGFQRAANDLAPPISSIAGNAIVSIILGSIFYDMAEDTSTFYGRGVLIFFTILTNTFLGAFEGVQLWAQRPIVEKHHRYAFYHPSAEAVASMLCDLPNKLLLTAFFNVPVYYLANMRKTPAAFFTFYLFAFSSLLVGSMLFRTIGAMSRTLTSSIAPGANLILLLVIYTGFVLPVPSMHPWLSWFKYIDPVAFAFESLMINEFSGRNFSCSTFVPSGPGYTQITPSEQACVAVGADVNAGFVRGEAYLATSFRYHSDHLWRNLGTIMAFILFLGGLYLIATEYVNTELSKGDVLVFQRSSKSKRLELKSEIEAQDHVVRKASDSSAFTTSCYSNRIAPHRVSQAATFLWDGISYDVKTKSGSKRLLDDVDGWIKPGTLTALMGASGAGKTTLLNILAKRAGTGVIGGDMYIDSAYQHGSSTRNIGYAQQRDLHNATSTVREALIFSALLRQSDRYSKSENIRYVDEVIQKLDMADFADAVIGYPGAGLNVEQRKRVTIGIELAARPELLLFLDEPTSGLDSNTAWSICSLLRRLADNGQSILCTIHQPSRILFEMFDRLLFLKDGKTLYFGAIGANSRILTDYFVDRGAPRCQQEENPAEWLIYITNAIPESQLDWASRWCASYEKKFTKYSIESMKRIMLKPAGSELPICKDYAAPFIYQLFLVLKRNLENDWRTPSYLYSKTFLTLGAGLVNGFSFYLSEPSLQGIQNQIFSTFLLFTLHSNLVQLILPRFLESRDLYESHEQPSRTYSWQVFVLSSILAELPWQTLLAIIQFVTWYYPLGMYRNALITNELHQRGGLMFLIIWSFMIFSSTFSQMLATVMPEAATGVNISALLYSVSLIFGGVLVRPSSLPKFWTFMYRATPLTYFINAIVTTGIAGVDVTCAANEIVTFNPPVNTICGDYMENYLRNAGGRLLNAKAVEQCQYCPIAKTDDLLATFGMFYADRWRNFGISLVYSVFNIAGALVLYWAFRVPKGASRSSI